MRNRLYGWALPIISGAGAGHSLASGDWLYLPLFGAGVIVSLIPARAA